MNHRNLRLELMDAYRHRGRLLYEVRHLIPLSPTERECIALHTLWDAFVQAEQWNHAHYQTCPTDPASALQLIQRWHAAGAPKTFAARMKGALWYMQMQVKVAMFYTLFWLFDMSETLLTIDV